MILGRKNRINFGFLFLVIVALFSHQAEGRRRVLFPNLGSRNRCPQPQVRYNYSRTVPQTQRQAPPPKVSTPEKQDPPKQDPPKIVKPETEPPKHASEPEKDSPVQKPNQAELPPPKPQAPPNATRPTAPVVTGKMKPFFEFQYVSEQVRKGHPPVPNENSSFATVNAARSYAAASDGHGEAVDACFWGKQPTLVVLAGGRNDTASVKQMLTQFGAQRTFMLAKKQLSGAFAGLFGGARNEKAKDELATGSLTKFDDLQLIMLNNSEKIWNEEIYSAENWNRAERTAKSIGYRQTLAENQPVCGQPLKNIKRRIVCNTLQKHSPQGSWFDNQFESRGGSAIVSQALASTGRSEVNIAFSQAKDEMEKIIPSDRFKIASLSDKNSSKELLASLFPGKKPSGVTVAILDVDGSVAKGPDGTLLVWENAQNNGMSIGNAYYEQLAHFKKNQSPLLPPHCRNPQIASTK